MDEPPSLHLYFPCMLSFAHLNSICGVTHGSYDVGLCGNLYGSFFLRCVIMWELQRASLAYDLTYASFYGVVVGMAASEFGDWVLMVLLLHLIHWGQRALFFRVGPTQIAAPYIRFILSI